MLSTKGLFFFNGQSQRASGLPLRHCFNEKYDTHLLITIFDTLNLCLLISVSFLRWYNVVYNSMIPCVVAQQCSAMTVFDVSLQPFGICLTGQCFTFQKLCIRFFSPKFFWRDRTARSLSSSSSASPYELFFIRPQSVVRQGGVSVSHIVELWLGIFRTTHLGWCILKERRLDLKIRKFLSLLFKRWDWPTKD